MKALLTVLLLALPSCGQSFEQTLKVRTGCSGSQVQIGECLSKRFAGVTPHDLDKALLGSGFTQAYKGVYVYSGGYSYGISVVVHQQAGIVSWVTAT